jgi:hypothetical protein
MSAATAASIADGHLAIGPLASDSNGDTQKRLARWLRDRIEQARGAKEPSETASVRIQNEFEDAFGHLFLVKNDLIISGNYNEWCMTLAYGGSTRTMTLDNESPIC